MQPSAVLMCHKTTDYSTHVENKTQIHHHHTTPQSFYGHFSETIRVSLCQTRTSGLYDARED